MKVSELIELLQGMDQNDQVHLAHSSGDYWRTVLAPSLDEVFSGYVQYSDYHRADKLLDEYDEEAVLDRRVVILK